MFYQFYKLGYPMLTVVRRLVVSLCKLVLPDWLINILMGHMIEVILFAFEFIHFPYYLS